MSQFNGYNHNYTGGYCKCNLPARLVCLKCQTFGSEMLHYETDPKTCRDFGRDQTWCQLDYINSNK